MVFRLSLHITGEFDYARFVLVPTRTETHTLSLSVARVSAALWIAVALDFLFSVFSPSRSSERERWKERGVSCR